MKPIYFVLLVLAGAAAQDTGIPVFRTGTRLVQVDVVVRGPTGPVLGLTKSDFELYDRGRRQEITVFSVRQERQTQSIPAAQPGILSNRPPARADEPVAATVILMDRQNTLPEDQGYAREQGLKYLERADRREQIALFSLSTTLTVLQPLTGDRDALHRALDKSYMEQPFNVESQFGVLAGLSGNAVQATIANGNQRRADITTAALVTIARYLHGLPGRKKLVWITAALPLTFTQETTRNEVTITEYSNLSPQLFAATRTLNDANVALYPIDPRGVFPGVLSDPGITAMIRLADMTGGKAFYAANDLSNSLEQAVSDTDVTYTLGFSLPEDELDGTFHSLNVKVNRPEVEVRHRKGHSAAAAPKPLTDKQRTGALNAWVREPLPATEIGMNVRARPVANRAGYYAVEIAVDVAALQLERVGGRWKGGIDVAIVPDAGRKLRGLKQTIAINLTDERYAQVRAAGLIVANSVKVTNAKGKPLADELQVVVMDRANGNAGSVRVPVQ